MTRLGKLYARPLTADGAPVGEWTLVGETDGDLTFETVYDVEFELSLIDARLLRDLCLGEEPTPIFYGVLADLGDPTRAPRV